VFGLFNSAVSHIVRDVKEQIKKDPRVGNKAKTVNSQFNIWPRRQPTVSKVRACYHPTRLPAEAAKTLYISCRASKNMDKI
jgi:hypothetical protein